MKNKKQTNIIMNTLLKCIVALVFVSASVTAQVDRSKQPEPGPAPKINLEQPTEFTLDNGLKVLVVVNKKLPRVSYNLTIDNKPDTEGKIAGVNSILAEMLGNGTTSIPKDEFNEEVDFLGAQIGFGSEGGYASGLSKYNERILQLLADGTKNPLLTQEQFEQEKAKLIDNLKSQEKSVEAVADRVGSALVYGSNHPYGEFITQETINNITLDDVRAYYQQNFNPENAYLVIIGDVDLRTTETLVRKYFSDWSKNAEVSVEIPAVKPNPPRTEINFVNMPNAVQSNVSLTHNIKLKMSDPDYFPVLLANRILGGGFNSYLNMNLREAHGFTYGARSSIGADRYASRVTAGASVRNAVTDSVVVEILKEVNRIRETPVSKEDLVNAKAKYVGEFVMALERPSTVARYALNIKTNNLPEDFYTTYLKKINDVTVEDIQRVAKKYLHPDKARIVIVGKGKEVLKGLEETEIPIVYFDEYANQIPKPDFNAAVPQGVTSKSVFNNYIKAIGGLEAVKGVNSLSLTAKAEVQPGVVLTYSQKNTSKGHYMNNVTGMGQDLSKTVLKPNGDFSVFSGGKLVTEGNDTNMVKSSMPIPELTYVNENMGTVESVEDVNGVQAYKVKISDDLSSFYSLESGLKIKDERNSGGVVISTFYSNYNTVEGSNIKLPYTIGQVIGGQTFNFEVNSIEMNANVTDADFE